MYLRHSQRWKELASNLVPTKTYPLGHSQGPSLWQRRSSSPGLGLNTTSSRLQSPPRRGQPFSSAGGAAAAGVSASAMAKVARKAANRMASFIVENGCNGCLILNNTKSISVDDGSASWTECYLTDSILVDWLSSTGCHGDPPKDSSKDGCCHGNGAILNRPLVKTITPIPTDNPNTLSPTYTILNRNETLSYHFNRCRHCRLCHQ